MASSTVGESGGGAAWFEPDSAIRHFPSHLRLWVIALLGLVLDLWSKSWAFTTLTQVEHRPVVKGWLSFVLSYNTGALFGIGKGFKPVFILASVAAFAFVLYLFGQYSRTRKSLHYALGMIMAGALGNVYDRVSIGKVRDFIKIEAAFGDFQLWPWVFNVADMLLVVGVILLLINFWIDRRAYLAALAEEAEAESSSS
jgi:signal peptidase II